MKPPSLHGVNPHLVVEAILSRRDSIRAGRTIADNRRVALVIEGGGMRSVCSAGGAMALARLGLEASFDEVYATSAGAMNGSYLLSRQAKLGMSVYFDTCTTKDFYNPWRINKPLDIDYVIQCASHGPKRLDVKALADSGAKLYVALCDKSDAAVLATEVHSTGAPTLDVLKAAMAVPVIYGRSVAIGGRNYIDGGILVPFAIEAAISNGATDLLVLTTRPAGFVEQPPSLFARRILSVYEGPRSALSDAYGQKHKKAQLARDLAMGRAPALRAVNIATLCVDEDRQVDLLETNPRITKAAAIRYGENTMRAFGADPECFSLEE